MVEKEYNEYTIKDICRKMYTMFYEFGCEHCPFSLTDDEGNKTCKFEENNIKPRDWKLDR